MNEYCNNLNTYFISVMLNTSFKMYPEMRSLDLNSLIDFDLAFCGCPMNWESL